MIKKIDDKILGACTRFSHSLQRACGLTCYFVAKTGLFLTSLASIVDILNYFFPVRLVQTPLFAVVMEVIWLLIMAIRVQCVSRAEEHHRSGALTKPSELIPYTMERPIWRLTWTALSLYEIVFIAIVLSHTHPKHPVYEMVSELFMPGNAIFFYFIAVNPLPPGFSKLRQWIESFKRKPIPLPSES